MKENNKWKYAGDDRYMKVYNNMQLLGIQDVTTSRQHKNGTIVWRLPIKSQYNGKYLEYASFKSGYVRNQGVDSHSNWQINKREMGEPVYYPEYKWKTLDNGDYTQVKTGKYRKFTTRGCKLIPIEIHRLEYMLKYIIKNEFIKRANYVANGDYIPKWQYDQDVKDYPKMPEEVTLIIDGHRYKYR